MSTLLRAQALEIPSGRELPALSASMEQDQPSPCRKEQCRGRANFDRYELFLDIQNQLSRLKDVLKAKRDDAAHTRTLIRDEIGRIRK